MPAKRNQASCNPLRDLVFQRLQAGTFEETLDTAHRSRFNQPCHCLLLLLLPVLKFAFPLLLLRFRPGKLLSGLSSLPLQAAVVCCILLLLSLQGGNMALPFLLQGSQFLIPARDLSSYFAQLLL